MIKNEKIFLMLTCHIVFLGSDLHLGFVNILDYSCAVDKNNRWKLFVYLHQNTTSRR